MVDLPIVFLAFANDFEGRAYLRKLTEELQELQSLLEMAEKRKLCKLVIRYDVSVQAIRDVFTEYGSRVAVFHFGGHAGSDRLWVGSTSGSSQPAFAGGLAGFLREVGPPHLVFLNGCSTQGQVARLLEAGIAVVVATARAIDDGKAREFAGTFYKALVEGEGASLEKAYNMARHGVRMTGGEEPRNYVDPTRDLGPAVVDGSGEVTDDHGFPWRISTREGNHQAAQWSLPGATNNPLYGLEQPLVGTGTLPRAPYVGLASFTTEQAVLFFGRGRVIRSLYNRVTTPETSSVILYCGQTGVGKSSVLAAGLLPRLAPGCAGRCWPRHPVRGLLGTLLHELSSEGEPRRTSPDLAAVWRENEYRLGHPLILILDQAEEAFTRPASPSQFAGGPESSLADESPIPTAADSKAEVVELALALRHLRDDRGRLPGGKLIISFRKEWLPEFQSAFDAAGVHYLNEFLEPLDRQGIIEAISGPGHPTLKEEFRLTLSPDEQSVQPGEPTLAELIADDLLAYIVSPKDNALSPIAPTLQVLLSGMWEEASLTNSARPTFTRELYVTLKTLGYRLTDFLRKTLDRIQSCAPEASVSGLVLDLLEAFTTPLGTAAKQTRAHLDRRYRHHADQLDGLLEQCNRCYLIAEMLGSSGKPEAYRLAHDTLAPLIRERFLGSFAPGQRARRVLEHRASEWSDGRVGSLLDLPDLQIVEAGLSGMRALGDDETRLLEASRRARSRQRATAVAQRLTSQARSVSLVKPQRSLLLAIEAIRVIRDEGLAVALSAEAIIRCAVANLQGRALFRADRAIIRIVPRPDGRILAVSDEDVVYVWDPAQPDAHRQVSREDELARDTIEPTPDERFVRDNGDGTFLFSDPNNPDAVPVVFQGQPGEISAQAVGPGGLIALGGRDGDLIVGHLTGPDDPHRVIRGHEGPISAIAFVPQDRLITASLDGPLRVWDLNDLDVAPIVLRGHEDHVRTMLVTADGRLLTGGNEGEVWEWDLSMDRLIDQAEFRTGRNLSLEEWQQYLGTRPYRRTFPDLPDGQAVSETSQSE